MQDYRLSHPDAHGEGHRGIGHRLVHEAELQVDGGTERLARRGEHSQGLVTA